MTGRLHHLRIRKARGLRAVALGITGRGLWTVQCDACPGVEFLTYRRHDQAVTVAALHIRGMSPGWAMFSTDLSLTLERAARIRARFEP